MLYFLKIVSAFALDALFGDPRWYPHPVKLIGRFIAFAEKKTRVFFSNMHLAGLVTVFLTLFVCGGAVFGLLHVLYSISLVLADVISVVLLYMSVAAKDLLQHSNAVARLLEGENSLHAARVEIAKIVGRDTAHLDQQGICRACIETVAENLVDGVTAPLFWAVAASLLAPYTGLSPIACSATGALVYKAVNTMDSMIGYKNEKYREFGRSAARLDDVMNFFPARMSGICLIIAAFFLNFDYRGSARIFLRDRLNHKSPNAGHTEAAAAGALNIQLGGPLEYFGAMVEKEYIGDDNRPVTVADIGHINRMILLGSVIFLLTAILPVILLQELTPLKGVL